MVDQEADRTLADQENNGVLSWNKPIDLYHEDYDEGDDDIQTIIKLHSTSSEHSSEKVFDMELIIYKVQCSQLE